MKPILSFVRSLETRCFFSKKSKGMSWNDRGGRWSKVVAVAVMLMAALEVFGQTTQTLNWNTNNNRSKYYNMCGNSNSSSTSLATCTSCSVTYVINESDMSNHNRNVGWMSFKAPSGCTITATLTSNGIESADWLYVSQGTTEDDGGSNYWTSTTTTGTTYSSTTGGWLTLYFDDFTESNNSSFTVRISCNCSGGGGGTTGNGPSTSYVCGSETHQVGSGSETNYSTAPVNDFYNYSYRQIIYTETELGGCHGLVHAIGFQYAYSTAMSTKTDVTIYMATTTMSEFASSSSWVTSGLQQVYHGSMNFTSQGWAWIELSTPFNYNTGNLLVVIDDNSGDYDGLSYTFYTHTGAYNRHLYIQSDSEHYNSSNLPSSASIGGVRPNTKFCIDCCTVPDFSFAQDVVYCVNGGSCAGQTVSVNQSGGMVSYSSSNTAVASVNPTTGAVTVNGTGTTTITATVAKTGDFCATTAEYTLVVQCGNTPHTLTYNTQANCTGGSATTVPSYTGTSTTVTTTTPNCTSANRFVGWYTNASGTGTRYLPGQVVDLSCGNVTLYAVYSFEPDTIQGATTCEEAQAFCASNDDDNGVVLMAATDVPVPDGMCTFFHNASWWYLQVSQAGRLEMTISSTAGDVDFGCWGPFNNFTCAAADLSDNAATESYYTSSTASDWGYHVGTEQTAASYNSPICDVAALTYPCGNLVDFGGSTSAVEYLQIDNAQVGQIYVVLVANYIGSEGTITFTQTNFNSSNHGMVDCDIVSDCEINVVTTNPSVCNAANNTYTVSGDIYFTDAPSDGTLTIKDITANPPVEQQFFPPFASPTSYSLELTSDGTPHQLEASFESTTTNCTRLANYTAPAPCIDCASTVSHTNVSCHGRNDGSITLNSTSGYGQRGYYIGRNGATPTRSDSTSAVSYTWSNLQPGTYVVYVIDVNGCRSEQTVTITEQPELTLSITTPTTGNCPIAAGQNYAIAANPNGGTGAYQNYTWSVTVDGVAGTIGGVGNNASIASDGTCHEYVVSLSLADGDGCTASATSSFSSADNTNPWFNNTSLLANPTVPATQVSGCGYQVPDLVALLAPEDNCTIASMVQAPLVAGSAITATTNITVTVTDMCGRSVSQAISVTVPDALTADIDKTNVACNGGNNGSVTLSNVIGGTPDYAYTWSSTGANATNVTNQHGTSLTGLSAGTYTVTITDQNGCTLQKTAEVSQAGSLAANISAVRVDCYGGSTGSSVSLSGIGGGTGSLHYIWSQTIGGSTTILSAEEGHTSISNYPAGSYTVVITDDAGCSLTLSADISEPEEMRVDIDNTSNINCYGNATGSIDISAYGGDGNYTYSWTGPDGYTSHASDLTGLRAGSYNITVTDNHNCTASNSATLTQPDTLVANAGTSATQICNGGSATISVTALGGNDIRYTYLWDNGSTAASQPVSPAITTTYHVTVTDANNCTDNAEVTVTVNQPTSGIDVQVACDTYDWHGQTYTSSNNTATYTTTGANGCDSVTTLNLTINHSNSAVFEATACESFEWHGETYTSSTQTPTYTTTNAVGCDSVTTLHLTMYQNDFQSHYATACDTYTWTIRGNTYTRTSSCDVVDTYTIGACTGADTLHLTIHPSTTGVDYREACDEYSWLYNGWSYTNSISATSPSAPRVTLTGANSYGCDTTIVLNLTINHSTSGVFAHTACESYLWPMNSQTYYATPTVAPSVPAGQNAAGCDSTVTLQLTVNHSTSSNDVHTACGSYTWPLNGQTYTSSTSVPQVTITNRSGCDSTITLRLTINNVSYGSYADTVCYGEQLTYRGNRYPAGQHTVTLTGSNGCDSIVALQVVARPSLTISLDEYHSCELGHYQVTGVINGSNNVNHFWTSSPSDPDVEIQRDALELSLNPTQPTDYTLTAGYGSNRMCAVSQTISLTPLNLPIADITLNPPFLTCDDLDWTAYSASQNAESISWYVNDIEAGNEESVSGSAQCNDDSVRISLVAVNGICTSVRDTVIYVRKSQLWFPNVFTPNLNFNKTFNAIGRGIVDYELYVYTREGLLVFHTTTLEEGWKGDHNGVECPRATYTYIARYRNEIEPDVWHKKIGTVTLLR